MFALIAAIILFLAVIFRLADFSTGKLDLLLLALAFWALHFAFTIGLPTPGWRRQ